MHRLFPPPVLEIDLEDIYRDERPLVAGRPWLMINMISTVDGVTEVEGVSGPLGSPGDKDVFSAVRALPDIILVGSTTAVAEHYNPPSTSVSTKARRLTNGAWPVARIAVVSAQLEFDLTLPMFSRPSQRPIVATTTNADPSKLERVADVADVIQCGVDSVNLTDALHEMSGLGAQRVLCEGGPSLNGALFDEGLVDEVFVTVAPLVGGGESRGIARGANVPRIQELELRHVLAEDHFLFLRYTRPA
ncbi:MAG: dihydrofolate reductase family protein [Acidimicrobiales bacterium]|nr:dihydrofolate reductase family protein [Acidimicrobiales bacterium]